jgi:DNA repair ATPase RecN
MKKIANAQELTAELQRLVQEVSNPNPSRHKIAKDLRSLASRVARATDAEDGLYGLVEALEDAEHPITEAMDDLEPHKRSNRQVASIVKRGWKVVNDIYELKEDANELWSEGVE